MKTPQQIKNEVEKEIEELKEEAEKELIIYKEEKDFFERRKQYSSLQNIIIKLREREAKLSILTEYDKSIKEMIESCDEEPCCHGIQKNELLSQLNSKEKKDVFTELWDNPEDDRWDKEEITGGEE